MEFRTTSNLEFSNTVRMTMMSKIPSKKDGCTKGDSAIVAIQKIDGILSAITTKLP